MKIKNNTKERMLQKIKDDHMLGEDTISDHNNIDFLVNMTNTLKITELVILILNISYFVGILFMIVAEVNMAIAANDSDSEYFIDYFEIEEVDEYHKTILIIYYAFTSLSTVGFGDLNPRSDTERIFCSFMLCFGVAIFSYIMGIFIEVLEKSKSYSSDDIDYYE